MGNSRNGVVFLWCAVASAVFATACGGGAGPTGPKADGGGGDDCDVPALFARSCGSVACHNEADNNPAAGLDLISPGVGERLALVNAQDCFGVYADPSDPTGSLLYTKVAGTSDCGTPMPLGDDPLTPAEVLCIRDWISGLQPPEPTDDGSVPPDDAGLCAGCVCHPGITEACYDHLKARKDVAMCIGGTHTCQISGQWGPCVDQVLPSVEDCHEAADEDCDGVASGCTTSWSIGYGVTNDQAVEGVGTDDDGNVYVIGSFSGSQDFGTGMLTAPTPPDDWKNNVFFVKYDVNGAAVWAKNWGDTSNQLAAQVAVDGDGNSAVLIRTRGTMNLGGSNLTSKGDNDYLVGKFTAEGTHVWSKLFGGTMLDRGERIAFDGAGNVLVTGLFAGTVDAGVLGTKTAEGDADGIVLKFDSATGALEVATRLGGTGDGEYGFGIDSDADGNIYVTGRFDGTMTLGLTTLVAAGEAPDEDTDAPSDIFVAKLTPTGAFEWAKRFGSAQDDRAYDLVVDPATDDIVITGYFSDAITFGDAGDTLTSNGLRDIFVARLDSDGDHIWSRGYGDEADQLGPDTSFGTNKWSALALDASGHIYLGGPLWGAAEFNPASPGTNGLIKAKEKVDPDEDDEPAADAFFVKLTGAGAFVVGYRYGGTGSELAQDIAVSAQGRVVLVGRFYGSGMNFGAGGTVAGASGDAEGFIVQLDLD